MTLRFAALGDSLTEGIGDPVPGGWRGWAALLAPALSEGPVDFHNLAASGTLAEDPTERQLPYAVAVRPHLAAVLGGGNDTLRTGFAVERTAERLDAVLRALSGQGAVLLTACLPDPGRLLGLPAPLAVPLARRMRSVNTAVHTLTTRYRAVHLHLAELPWQDDRKLLGADRLHPSALGHHLIARGFHARLAAAGHPVGPAPAAVPGTPPPGLAADLRWLATQGTRWVAARSTDLLPGLLALAATECRHRLRGTGHRLDANAERATTEALARLPVPLVPAPRPWDGSGRDQPAPRGYWLGRSRNGPAAPGPNSTG
ncbi:SGNH/GDSL hydrolase family protein [Kitasatospora camelliae]|uniref:SGNH/GDSL hydrolase family protein n=1 Tax=Kitasatospora camelliae TaxID=3156397 RepID=A0AAU8JQV6_9ACTN